MGKITENGLKILQEKKYFKEGESSWEDIVERVSTTISKAEFKSQNIISTKLEIQEAMNNMKFLFSSPCLINANPNDPGQYSSCFIIDLKDNVESIFGAVAKIAKICQKSGGVGISNISVLRPKNSKVEKSSGYSCGPTYFMKVYNETVHAMTIANHSKRGAIKINMDVWHPNIVDFINLKVDAKETEYNLMNISVSLSDKFMNKVKNNEDWDLIFPDYENMDKAIYDAEWDGDMDLWLEKGYPVKVYETVKAKDLKNLIDYAAWKIGDPGFNYQDTMDRANMNKHIGGKIYTNPCNEFSNLPYTSCNLGSINIIEFVKDDNGFDYAEFSKYVKKAVRWLDDMISVNKLPLPIIQQMTEDLRPIGLGLMGFAGTLYKMGITYGNNDKCNYFIKSLMEIMKNSAIEASVELAKERGVYPKWEDSEWSKQGIRIRNSNVLSIAPTGTLSALAGVDGGIEPAFALVYYRKTNNDNIYFYINQTFEQELKNRGLYSEELLKKVADNHGSCIGIDEIPKDMQEVFVTAHDITPKDHVLVTAQFQKYVDLSISKTINFPNDATVEDISNIIELGWESGCKGLTVYRDGCKQGQTLSTKPQEKKETVKEVVKEKKSRKDFGRVLSGNTYSSQTSCGTFYFTLNRNPENNKIMETFVNIKSGLCKSNVDALNRMISLGLRRGIPVEDVIDQLKGITCSACQNAKAKGRKMDGLSCADAMGRMLELETQKETKPIEVTYDITDEEVAEAEYKLSVDEALLQNLCPDCSARLDHVSGCIQCNNCGWSKC